ncbi:unnamed protein product [Menidia menidia]|uniref:Cilia- and flagella-associated protein 251 n=1 Tax=Menidia menidia TaxID=238744 RepID=A0A8S4AYG5_9TELE|nr:unnamed protein product [Menidia menidia]
MSDTKAKPNEPSMSNQSENQQHVGQIPDSQSSAEDEGNDPDKQKTTGQSQVYTATKESIFSKKTTPPSNHPLRLDWIFGMNPTLPVFCLQDHDQLLVLYAGAHVGIIYNQTSNIQHILRGHSHPISSMCVTEDKRWIATADHGTQSMVLIWDSYSGIPVKTFFDCHGDGGVKTMTFSSDGKYLATLGNEEDQCVCIWDWTSEAQEPFCSTQLEPGIGFQDYIIFKPNDSTQLLSGSKSHVLFYRRTKECLQYFALKLKKFNDEAKWAAVCSQQSPDPPKSVSITHMSRSQSAFHWIKPKILTAILGSVLLWDIREDLIKNQSLPAEKVKFHQIQEHPITILTVADSCVVTGDTLGNIYFYDETFRVLTSYSDLTVDPIVSISFSKECSEGYIKDCSLEAKPLLVRNFVVSTISAKVVHVNTQSGTSQTLLHENYEPLCALACHPSQPAVAMGNQQGFLKLWDYNNKAVIVSRAFDTERDIQCITFDPKGFYMAVGFGSGAVHILNAQTLQSLPEECFHYTKDRIHLITFSSDSQYLATADAGKAVTVFHLQSSKDSLPRWMYLGRHCSHYKPISDLLFGVHLDSTQARLLSLGKDRRLVEYDLEKSVVNQLHVVSSERIEQSAVPLCMTWYPPLTTEQFLLVASDQYKMKLFNSTTKMCRKTLLGPTYGSPVKQIVVLPKSKDPAISSYQLSYITEDKVGLQILPLDGNPYKSCALICHPTGASTLACSYDGRLVFTAGGSDCSVISWEINLNVMEAAVAMGGKDIVPFYSLIDGGRDGKFFREIEDFFYYCLIRHHGTNLTKKRQVPTRIPLSEVPFLMRALGYFPTAQEIEDMQNEVKFSKYAETGNYVTDVDLEEFIRLYVNHRPAFGISSSELLQAFQVLGRSDSAGQLVLPRQELLELLQVRGEHMTEEEVAECFTSLLGLNDEEGEGEEEATALCEDSDSSLEGAIPEEMSMETFTGHILGLPSFLEPTVRSSSPE